MDDNLPDDTTAVILEVNDIDENRNYQKILI